MTGDTGLILQQLFRIDKKNPFKIPANRHLPTLLVHPEPWASCRLLAQLLKSSAWWKNRWEKMLPFWSSFCDTESVSNFYCFSYLIFWVWRITHLQISGFPNSEPVSTCGDEICLNCWHEFSPLLPLQTHATSTQDLAFFLGCNFIKKGGKCFSNVQMFKANSEEWQVPGKGVRLQVTIFG